MLTSKQHYAQKYHLQVATTPDNQWLYGYIRALNVRSVLEFGCNQGRHLVHLQKQGCEVAGIDINARAVEAAKLLHDLEIQLGDEEALAAIPSQHYDLVLTCSVLSHMEEIEDVLPHLVRIAKKHVILVETRSRVDHQNYWWEHDYPGTSVHSYYAQQVNAVYQVWHLQK